MSTIQAIDLQLSAPRPMGAFILAPIGKKIDKAELTDQEIKNTKPATKMTVTPDGRVKEVANDDSIFASMIGNALGLPIEQIHIALSAWEVISEEILDKNKQQVNLTTQAKPKPGEFVPSSKKALLLQQEKQAENKKKRFGALQFS